MTVIVRQTVLTDIRHVNGLIRKMQIR